MTFGASQCRWFWIVAAFSIVVLPYLFGAEAPSNFLAPKDPD
jgi:hypothetical protein